MTGTTDDTFTYILTDQLDHPAPVSDDLGDAQTLALNLSPAIKATDRDGDPISLGTSLRVTVEDDVPVLKGNTFSIAVQEDALNNYNSENGSGSTGNGEVTTPLQTTTATITYANLLSLISAGADENAIFTLNSAIGTTLHVQTTDGIDVTSKGSLVSYRYNETSGQIEGISADGRLVFTLTQNTGSDGVTGTTDDTFTYELKDQLDHPLPGSTDDNQTMVLNLSQAIKATDRDGDPISLGNSLQVTVEDDVPIAENGPDVTVTEGDPIFSSSSHGAAYNLLNNDKAGADEAITISSFTYHYNLDPTLTNTAAAGSTVNALYGELRVNADGSWSFTPNNHIYDRNSSNENLGAVTESFNYTIRDFDGDTSSASQNIVINDTNPAFGAIVPKTLYEKNLLNGSDPAAPVSVTDSLKVIVNPDGIADTYFLPDTAPPADGIKKMKSGDQEVSYYLSADHHTLIGYTGSLPISGEAPPEGQQVFVITINNPGSYISDQANYTFTLLRPLDHTQGLSFVTDTNNDGIKEISLPFHVGTTDTDGDSANASFNVIVVDDNNEPSPVIVLNEDTSKTITINADAAGQTTITGIATYGTATVNSDGTITYEPKVNYSGQDEFTYTLVNDNGPVTITKVVVTVNPVSDAPLMDDTSAVTAEDQPIALGLAAPVIKDSIDQNGTAADDDPERFGLITLGGIPEGAQLLKSDGTVLFTGTASDHDVTIRLTDGSYMNGIPTAELTELSTSDFNALKILPPPDRNTDFTVTMSVTEYEVDGSGNQQTVNAVLVPGVSATVNDVITVNAVTDHVDLKWQSTAPDTTTDPLHPDSLDSLPLPARTDIDPGYEYLYDSQEDGTLSKWINEDSTFNLKNLLEYTAVDPADKTNSVFGNPPEMDGSEHRYIVLSNLLQGTVVNGTTIGAGGTISIRLTGDKTLPDINITPLKDFSGNIDGIKVTLTTIDTDITGETSLIVQKEDFVMLNLHVKPVASGDLVVADPAANYPEDTKEIKFLTGVSVTDTSSDLLNGGMQTITALTVKGIPDGWTVLDPAGSVVALSLDSGTSSYYFTVTDFAHYKDYSITPPAHSSKDAALLLDITTVDNNTDTGTSSYSVTDQPLAIKLTPVAEQFALIEGVWKTTNTDGWIMRSGDSDSDGSTDDLRMNEGHPYTAVAAKENQSYSLGTDGSFNLRSGWYNDNSYPNPSNEDTDETTTALFTPTVNGDASLMRGAQFTYDGLETPLVFNGNPVEIPISKLDSLQFTPPSYYSTDQDIVINVQAKTVDPDPDGGPAATAISGLALLTIHGILPVDSLLSVNAYSPGGNEDTEIPLYIRPITKDVDGSEKSVVTITDIPDGATLRYNGAVVPLTFMSGSSGLKECTIGTFSDPYVPATSVPFNPDASLTLTPPFNSNLDYELTVAVTSKDTNGSAIVTTTLPSVPIDINVRGVADGMVISKVSPIPLYPEAAVESASINKEGLGQHMIPLKNLIDTSASATYLKDTDNSEVATFKITALVDASGVYASDFFDLKGTGVELIKGDGAGRIWTFPLSELNNIKILVPEEYRGTVTFKLYPVTTENDGDSITGVQKPYPDGPQYNVPLELSFDVVPNSVENIEGALNLSLNVNEDTLTRVDFTYLSEDTHETFDWVIIKSASLVKKPFTLYYDPDGAGSAPTITLDAAVEAGYIDDAVKAGYTEPGYKISGSALGNIYVQTAPDVPVPGTSGSTYAFDLHYQITDHAVAPYLDDIELFDGSYTLHSIPVTDPVVIEDFLVAKFKFSNANASVVDNSDPDTGTVIGTVTATGSTIITLKVTVQQTNKLTEVVDPAKPPVIPSGNGSDIDGTERLVRLLIDGVPDGVTVGLTVDGIFVPATYVGDLGTSSSPPYERINRWLLDVDQSFLVDLDSNPDGHVAIPLQFALNGSAAELKDKNALITVTAESHDIAGSSVGDTVTTSMSWRLTTESTFNWVYPGIPYSPETEVPAKIDSFAPLSTPMVEDTPVTLDTLLSYTLQGSSPLSIILANPPDGTLITGMEKMTVDPDGNGPEDPVTFWRASVTPDPLETAEHALTRLLRGITVTPPPNSNDNWITSPPPPNIFTLDLTLTSYGANGVEDHKFAQADLPVAPRTDDTLLTITPHNVDEDSTAPFTVTIKIGPDGDYTELPPDRRLYLKLDDSLMDTTGAGLFSDAAGQIPVLTETNPAGLAAGIYYYVVVDLSAIKSSSGQTLQFYYVPATNASGSVALTAYLKTHEIGDLLNTFRLTQQAASFNVAPVNDGYDMHLADQNLSDPAITVVGNENAKIAIPITGSGLGDIDNPTAGSEKILNALLENVPVGYLVYYGGAVALAENLGDDGSGNNLWRIPVGGTTLPAIYIEPPPYVSGTINGLKLTVATSDKGVVNNPLSSVTFDLQVTPVANGFQLLNPTLSFGVDGFLSDSLTASNRILLNLNAGMFDLDGSETATLSFKGIGNQASFCKGDGSILSSAPDPANPTAPYVLYNSVTDTYTLHQIPVYDSSPSNRFDVNNIYLVQSARYVPGVQVSAWTVESANGAVSAVSTGSFDLSIATYAPTSGKDTLLYDRAADLAGTRSYNALAGDDTLVLRQGEIIDFAADRAKLSISNIETIDLTVNGDHALLNITWQDVIAMTDSRHELYILGDSGDTLQLGTLNGWSDPEGSGIYNIYTNINHSTVKLYVDPAITQP